MSVQSNKVVLTRKKQTADCEKQQSGSSSAQQELDQSCSSSEHDSSSCHVPSKGKGKDIKGLGPPYPGIALLSNAELSKPDVKRILLEGKWENIDVYKIRLGMINGVVEVLWKRKDAGRRYHENTFVTTVDSLIDCAMTSVNDCKDCQYISFEEESESSKCFGYKSVTPSTASSYDVIPGAVIYGKLQTLSKEDRCVGAGYDYVGAVDLCYRFIFRQMTFEDAVTECGTAGNRLIVLDTGSKLELIRTIIHSTEGYELRIYWVDGNDKETEGTWLFSTGVGIPMNSTFWMTDEPNHGIIENCVCLYLGSHKFHDVSCNGLFYPICEMV